MVQMEKKEAKFAIGEVVKHRIHPFRGVIFDVDPTFSNTEEWWNSIPENYRPKKDQPFYHLLAENDTSYYVAYVSEQNLLPDDSGDPVEHPEVSELFENLSDGKYTLTDRLH
jgi:heat shock protein HspQ